MGWIRKIAYGILLLGAVSTIILFFILSFLTQQYWIFAISAFPFTVPIAASQTLKFLKKRGIYKELSGYNDIQSTADFEDDFEDYSVFSGKLTSKNPENYISPASGKEIPGYTYLIEMKSRVNTDEFSEVERGYRGVNPISVRLRNESGSIGIELTNANVILNTSETTSQPVSLDESGLKLPSIRRSSKYESLQELLSEISYAHFSPFMQNKSSEMKYRFKDRCLPSESEPMHIIGKFKKKGPVLYKPEEDTDIVIDDDGFFENVVNSARRSYRIAKITAGISVALFILNVLTFIITVFVI